MESCNKLDNMIHVDKVFESSCVTRQTKTDSSNLLKLLNTIVETDDPPQLEQKNEDIVKFPLKRPKQNVPPQPKNKKVKTVGEIRCEYEQYVYDYLKPDLDKQNLILYNKIKSGSPRKETLDLVRSILENDAPISRTTWNMITNLNPKNYLHKKQFVFWNGRKIKISGSLGGSKSVVINDPYGVKNRFKSKTTTNNILIKKSLLLNLPSSNFKPGPLSKKKKLDMSYEKYNIGASEIMKLPKICVEVTPLYGAAFTLSISNYLHGMREENGVITEQWADFATIALGSIINNKPVQCTKDTSKSFNVSYKNNQNHIVMRNCTENTTHTTQDNIISYLDENITIPQIVESVVNKIIDSVIINTNQDDIEFDPDQPYVEDDDTSQLLPTINKDKTKRNSELERLDVTVIRLPENNPHTNTCEKMYCKLGCVCYSLQCGSAFKDHCGKAQCMFGCQCNYEKRDLPSLIDSNCLDVSPVIINYNNKLNSGLAKEEKKFHQTVVVTDDKSFFLKSRKRNWQNASKVCYNNKNEVKELFISLYPLKIEDAQCFCLVHDLYKCFCKNRFVKSFYKDYAKEADQDTSMLNNDTLKEDSDNRTTCDISTDENETPRRRSMNKRIKSLSKPLDNSPENGLNVNIDIHINKNMDCSRSSPFTKRNFDMFYYKKRNARIKSMEENDVELLNKLLRHMNCKEKTYEDTDRESLDLTVDVDNVSTNNRQGQQINLKSNRSMQSPTPHPASNLCNEEKLKKLLEIHYKQYRKQTKNGKGNVVLYTPTPGKFCLIPWDTVILRYKMKKNYFFVTIDPPVHVFLTIGLNVLENCINIDDIKVCELSKYPASVISLLRQQKHPDRFCIMYGYTGCWEIKCCVTRLSDNKDKEVEESDDDDYQSDTEANVAFDIDTFNKSANLEYNKWLVLPVDERLGEIRLYKKGFFVKTENVAKSMEVSRVSGKPVRLSPQSSDKSYLPQFGIYATPSLCRTCVLIGPYSLSERHGIKLERKFLEIPDSAVSGRWIINKKENNLSVLENPVPFLNKQCDEEILYYCNNETQVSTTTAITTKSADKDTTSLRPIKIRKNNMFYLRNSDGVLKPVSVVKPSMQENATSENWKKTSTNNIPLGDNAPRNETNRPPNICFSTDTSPQNVRPNVSCRPTNTLLNIDHQISATQGDNETGCEMARSGTKTNTSHDEGSSSSSHDFNNIPSAGHASSNDDTQMSENESNISPGVAEERNVDDEPITSANEIIVSVSANESCGETNIDSNDIDENYILPDDIPSDDDRTAGKITSKQSEVSVPSNGDASSTKLNKPSNIEYQTGVKVQQEIVCISDDEEDELKNCPVWIECTNVYGFGAIKGNINKKNELNFKLPSLKLTKFYEIKEAFIKINQILSKRIYLSNNLELKWQIVRSHDLRQAKSILRNEDLEYLHVNAERKLHRCMDVDGCPVHGTKVS